MRSYGIENFNVEEFGTTETREEASAVERHLIESYPGCPHKYNLLPGGDYCGFHIADVNAWKEKLKEKRVGKTPTLGMKHRRKQKIFSEVSKTYWKTQETYKPESIIGLTHREAKEKLGVSTTHYYRLRRKLAKADDLG